MRSKFVAFSLSLCSEKKMFEQPEINVVWGVFVAFSRCFVLVEIR